MRWVYGSKRLIELLDGNTHLSLVGDGEAGAGHKMLTLFCKTYEARWEISINRRKRTEHHCFF